MLYLCSVVNNVGLKTLYRAWSAAGRRKEMQMAVDVSDTKE